MKTALTLALGLFCSLIASDAFAQLTYDESTDGDLSGAFGTPAQLIFDLGVNTITGEVGSGNSGGATNGTDADYFTFSLGVGEVIDSITITRDGPGNVSFIGYVNDSSFGGQTAGDLNGNTLFADGDSLLPGGLIASSLTAGDHAFWIQETGGTTDYSISLNVTSAVPEPSSAIALLGLGVVGLVRRKR